MSCAFCGEGNWWIKTCRTKVGSRLQVCDPYWEVLSPWLVLVPGDRVVTARCDGCRAYFNPREMAECSLGGHRNTYSGTCETCAKVDTAIQSEATNTAI
jgi:hypothetical protein